MNHLKARCFIILMWCVLSASNTFGQIHDPDSALTAEVKSAFWLANNYPDSALLIAGKGLEQAHASKNKTLAAYSYKTRGWAFFRSGHYDSCLQNLSRSTDLFKALGLNKETLYNYVNLAIVYSNHTAFDEAVDILVKADSLNDAVHDLRAGIEINRQLGIIHRERGDYPKALDYLREAFAYSLQLKDTLRILDAVSSLCIVYTKMSHGDSSLLLIKRFMPVYETLPTNDFHKASMYEQAGDAYLQLGQYQKAYASFLMAYGVFAHNHAWSDRAYEAMNLGMALIKAKKYHAAEKFLLEAYHGSDSLHLTHYRHDAASQLTLLYKTEGNWPSAYHWLETQKTLYDSLQYNERIEKAAALEAKYQAEKREKEILLLKKDRELARALMGRRALVQYGSLSFAGLILAFGFFAIRRYRLLQNEKRKLAVEQLRNDIARDLHDDMGSVISGINIISKVALTNQESPDAAIQDFRKIEQYSGYIQEKMGDIVWAISPGNDTFERLIVKMKEFTSDILEPLNINYVFNVDGEFKNTRNVDLNDRKDLYLFFKEVINNAAKYSGCTTVEIKVSGKGNGAIEMVITDNGKGFLVDQIQSGNGIANLRARAKRLNGEMAIESEMGHGTRVSLFIKPHE